MNSQLSSMTRDIRLGVNVDHIATLRQARGTRYPDPVQAAFLAEEAGADGITIHLREDRRHIQERDVRLMKETLTTPMNLEIAVTDEMISFAKEIEPEHVCLVPEKREELTTEGGLDVVSNFDAVSQACQSLAASGIQVSLFIDADLEQIEASARAGAPAIELHTGQYAETEDEEEREVVLSKLYAGAKFAQEKGLIVNAGHGLHYHNTRGILDMPALNELNIGHSIIARALFVGLKEAVREMKRLIESGTPHSKESHL